MIELIDITDLSRGLSKHVWQSGLFFLAVLALTSMLRNGSARVRYSLWFLVVVRLIVPVSITMPTSLWPHEARQQTLNTILDPISALSGTPTAGDDWVPATPTIASSVVSAPSPFPWEGLLIALWIAVSGALLARYTRRASEIRSIERAAIAAPTPWSDACRKISRSLGLRGIQVRVSEIVTSPAAIGAFRPTVIIPGHLAQTLSPIERDAVLLHELTHIKRRDLAAQMLSALASVLFPFHPATWFASRKLARERELAVDEAVLDSKGIDAMSYAKTLVEVAAAVPATTGRPLHLAHLSAAGQDLKDRVIAAKSIASRAGAAPSRPRWPVAVAGLAFALTTLPTAPAVAAGEGELDRFVNDELKRAKITLPTSTLGMPITAGGIRAIILIDAPGAVPRVEAKTSPVTDSGFPKGSLGGFPALRGPKAATTVSRPTIEISNDLENVQVKLDGQVVDNADAVGNALKAKNPPGSVIAHVSVAPAVPVQHVAATIASLQGSMKDISIVFEGVHFDQDRMSKVSEALTAIPAEGDGDILLVIDQNVPWQQHAEVLLACAKQKIASTTVAVRGPKGELRKLCQYLPSDDAMMEEIEVEEIEPEEIEIEDGDLEEIEEEIVEEEVVEEEVVEEEGGGGQSN